MKTTVLAAVLAAASLTGTAQTPASDDGVRGDRRVRELLDDGEYAAAEQSARDAFRQQQSPSSSGTFANLLVEALVADGKGGGAETLTLARNATSRSALVSVDPLQAATAWRNLADVHVARGEFATALPFYERAIARLRSDPATRSALADVLDRTAFALIRLDRLEDAEERLRDSEQLHHTSGDDPAATARTQQVRALLYRFRGNYAEALATLEPVLAIERQRSPTHPDLVLSLQLLGDLRFLSGDANGAGQAWESALAIARQRLQPQHPLIAVVLHRLYSSTKARGDMAQARRLIEEATAIGTTSFGPCDTEVPGLLTDLANTDTYEGDYPKAQQLLTQAARILTQCLGPNHSLTATIYDNQGMLAFTIGDSAMAERLLQRAIRIWTNALGNDHPYVARGLDNLAEVFAAHDPARARTTYQRALEIRKRVLGEDHPDVAWTLINLASVSAASGDLALAANRITDALAIYRRGGLPQEPDHLARALELRGSIEMRRGEFDRARDTFEEARQTRVGLFGSNHPLVAASLADAAAAQFALGAHTAAVEAALDAETTGLDHLRFTIRYLPERQSMAYAATRPRGLDLALSIAATSASVDAAPVLDAVIRSRGVVLDELAARAQSTSAAADPELAALNGSMLAARQRYATLVLRSLEGHDAVPPNLLEDSRQLKEEAERAMAERSIKVREEKQQAQIGLDDVRRALPDGSALVSFEKYDRTIVAAGPSRRVLATTPSYIALVARKDRRDVYIFPLGTAAALEAVIEGWRAEAGGTSLTSASSSERTYRIAAAALRARVWDPIASSLADVTRVFIVPDGALNLVNFAALPVGNRYLVETGPTIHYLSTERDLVRRDAPTGHGLLALGGPSFDTRVASTSAAARRAGCGSLGALRFEDLPGSRAEIQEITRIWSDRNDVTVLRGPGATKAALTKAIVGRKVIHLATHGFFLGGDCQPASVPRTRGVGGLIGAAPTRLDNPLLLSGLALAGVNALSGVRQANALLNAEEIAGLNLQGTEWAVLSACDTGLGPIAAGEGVFGLRRAFQIAGVHTIIMSLWSVEDQATRDWMKALYDARLKQHLDTPDAVRTASLQLLAQRRARGESTHPFYWAAFVAAGDWR